LVQPDPGLYIWTIVTFLVLLALLARFAWRPLLDALEQRQDVIRKSLDEARQAKEELQRLQAESARILAEARSEADRDLLGKGQDDGWAFRFPAQAARELARLDPREAVAVDFLFPGDRVRRAYVEVGDFAAGRAFVQMAER
jgi:flagellar biosynthesis/type III secretory pathway M-ring protein FliF/YscJ